MSNTGVSTAITRLQKIYQAVGAAYMPYFLTPNALLSLGDMRVLSVVRIDSPTEDDTEALRAATATLDPETHYCQPEEGTLRADDQPYAGASVYSRAGLAKLSRNFLMPLPPLEDTSRAGMEEYLRTIEGRAVATRRETDPEDPANSVAMDWLAGLLYGYPEPAVAAMPGFWTYEYDTPEEYRERVHKSDIAHAMMYFESSAGTCVYDYPWFLAEHPDIVAHHEQWSRYLAEFYDSDWHREIARDPDLRATVERNTERDATINADTPEETL